MEKNQIIKYQEMVVSEVELQKENGISSDSEHTEKINPIVVALYVSEDEKVVIQSYRSECLEGDHAEFNLFMNKVKGESCKNGTLFVSLEPCNCDSRITTISCSELIVKAGIKKVYMGCFDPDIMVRGNGYCYLKEHRVEVELFEEHLQKRLIDANFEFWSSKLSSKEEYRRYQSKYGEFLSKPAMLYYLYFIQNPTSKIMVSETDIQKYEQEHPDWEYEFFKSVMKEKYIYPDIQNGKRTISADDGFKLAFFVNPKAEFRGASIKIIDKTSQEEIASTNYSGPAVLMYIEAYKSISNLLRTKMYDYEKILSVCREMLANAICHKDYESYAPIQIIVEKDKITITNPFKKDYIDLYYLNKFVMPSNPINGSLCDIAMQMHFMEGQGRGEQTLKEYLTNGNPYKSVCNILIVEIPFNI